MRIGSCDYGGWDMLWHAVCRLENQETQWYNLIRVQWPEKGGKGNGRGAIGIAPGVRRPENQELWYPKAGEDGCPSSRRKSEYALLPLFFSIGVPSGLDDAHIGEGGSFSLRQLIQMLISLLWTSSQTHPEITFPQLSGQFLSPIKLQN